MAELFVVGEVLGASGFNGNNLVCKYAVAFGENWRLSEGEASGQTQTDYPKGGMAIWSHPIDLHFTTRSVLGWPKLALQVFRIDQYGNYDLEGYGYVQIPISPGMYNLKCVTWKPTGTLKEEFAESFMGITPRLRDESLVVSSEDRRQLRTRSSGIIYVNLSLIERELERQGVSTQGEQSDGAGVSD
ncbi:MAG: putative transforming growth factor beta-1 precursor [Streblomastix strix]|uniref:B9 domain-containing protein 2 n=1 Tax=Streblomastix strix TaxID=222440 RepID=A0A5J4V244_9EUKA|nr:MAG: putative transforming growth factor beta-1 precursor [Streblomastix strix]